MTRRLLIVWAVVAAFSVAACTVNQVEVPPLTGPSSYATSLTMSANPDTTAMGLSTTSLGQQSLVIATVFDVNGQPKPNQTVRFETLVNNQLSACGQLSKTTTITGSDGRAATVFTAPGTPPDCPNFNADGSVTIRATPVGTDFQGTDSSSKSVTIFMALPTFVNSVGGFVVDFTVGTLSGTRNFTFNGSGSNSPGHAITNYTWIFSDGTTKTGSSPVVDHDFGSSGTYVVTLTVRDDIGQEGSKSGLLQVN